MGHYIRIVLGVLLGGLGTCYFVYFVVSALKTGIAQAAGRDYKRSKRPIMFWSTVIAQLFFAGVCCAFLIDRILRRG